MRVAAIADLHLDDGRRLPTVGDQERALDDVADAIRASGAHLLVIAGDFFDTDRPSPDTILRAAQFLRQLSVPIVIARGNHDPSASRLAALLGMVAVAPAAPEVISVPIDGGRAAVDCAILPWIPDGHARAAANGEARPEEVSSRLTTAAGDVVRGFLAQRRAGVPMVLVAHATVIGSDTESGFVFGSRSNGYVLHVEDLTEFSAAFVGHIHRRQILGDRVFVPGSTLPLDFSETEEKGVTVVTLAPGVGAFEIPAAPTSEFVPVWTAIPRTIDVEGREGVLALLGGATECAEKMRVRIRVDETTALQFPPRVISQALYAAGAQLVRVEMTVERADRRRDAGMTTDLDVARSVARYLATQHPEDTDRQRVLEARAAAMLLRLEEQNAGAGPGDLRVTNITATDLLGLEQATLDIEPGEMIVVTGPVGAGKSSLGADAVRFALFGASRVGARPTASLIREGADRATVAVELEDESGTAYRIVRSLMRGSRGSVSTQLDAMVADAGGWQPMADRAKIADGQKAIDVLLGGLDDSTFCASSVVIQRAADSFTRARPEDRRRLLAEAAGLSIFDSLAEVAQADAAAASRELERLASRLDALRPQAEAVKALEEECTGIGEKVAADAARIEALERAVADAGDARERAQRRLDDHLRLKADADRIGRERTDVESQIAEWESRRGAADEVLRQRAAIEADARRLADLRVQAEAIERERDAAEVEYRAAVASRDWALREQSTLERDLAQLEHERRRRLDAARIARDSLAEQLVGLRTSGCVERCQHTADCLVRTMAATLEERIAKMAEAAKHDGPSDREVEITALLAAIAIPDLPAVYDSSPLVAMREAIANLESRQTLVSAIARAEQVLQEHGAASEKLTERRAALVKEHEALLRALIGMGHPLGEHERAQAAETAAKDTLAAARRDARFDADRLAHLTGRLESCRETAAEMATVEGRIGEVSREAADCTELLRAWRAVRVSVLENEVIPAIEATANDVLRAFPYGISIAFRTQREKRDGGVAEALDLEVLGGLAPHYELLSGGQRTVVDVSLHIAIALVVARRATSRISMVFLDEPEGLDEVGRLAFSNVVSTLRTQGLSVLVASHHSDLISALVAAGARDVPIGGSPGAAVVGELAAERVEVAV